MKPIIKTMSIATGPQGTRETLRIMATLAREAADSELFRQFASVFKTPQEVDSIRQHYEYTPEPVETLYTPQYNLHMFITTGKFIGDCDDVAMLYAAVFYVKDIPARFVAMRTKQHDPDFYHVVVEAFIHGAWKRFDPTVPPSMVQTDYGRMTEYL